MIDEKLEVAEYLSGRKISKQNMYRICYLIAKHLRDSGMNAFDARQQIFKWANDNGVFIKFNLNDILNIVYIRDLDPLVSNKVVNISDEDIKFIQERFDCKKIKLLALALLCYAKAYANKKGEFQCSGIAVSSWLGISRSTYFRYMQELSLMGFIQQIDSTKDHLHRWQDRPLAGLNGNTYKIMYDWKNDGNYTLCGNEIESLSKIANL